MYRLLLTVTVMLTLVGPAWSQTPTVAQADFNGNGEVDFTDFLLFTEKYNTRQGDDEYEAKYDLDGNGAVEFADFLTFVGFFGETVPAWEFTEIAPAEGMSGELIELMGRFDVNTTYQVKFGTVLLPVFTQNAEQITAMVPVLESGSVSVRVVDAAGKESAPRLFEVLALPEPRMTAEQLQQTVAVVGEGIGNALAPVIEAGVISNSADAALFNREMAKLNAVWGVLGEEIAALPPEDAALLVHLLDNSGALGILEGLGKIDLSASKVATDLTLEHHMYFNMDVVSALMDYASKVSLIVTTVTAIVPSLQLVALTSGAVGTAIGVTKLGIDSFIPTDLQRVTVKIDPDPVLVGGRSEVKFFGDFETESNLLDQLASQVVGKGTKEIVKLLIMKVPGGKEVLEIDQLEKLLENLAGYFSGIISSIGFEETGLADFLSKAKSPQRDNVPLDISLYQITLFDMVDLVVPGDVDKILETIQNRVRLVDRLVDIDLNVVFVEPVKVKNENVAVAEHNTNVLFDKNVIQLIGKDEGTTQLEVKAFRFVPRWSGWYWWEEVSMSLDFSVGKFSLHGITYANNRFYAVDDHANRICEYNSQWELIDCDSLRTDNNTPLGITYENSNRRLWVVDNSRRLFRYFLDGRYLQTFGLAHDNSNPRGITYANDKKKFYVVDLEDKKVYVYGFNGDEWTHYVNWDFALDSDNSVPEGITYANNQFYVIDYEDKKVYVYDSSGNRVSGLGFALDSANRDPTGITYANDKFYVVDYNGTIYEYEPPPDLIVETPSVSDSILTVGESFTLSATVRNQGFAQTAETTTLRYYRSTNDRITKLDSLVGTDYVGMLDRAKTSVEMIRLTAPPNPGTYYYGACVDGVTGESDTNNNCSDAVRVVVNAGSTTTADRLALVALYQATKGDSSWTNKTNWLSDKPLNEWYGVSTNAQGRVNTLDLSENGLSGNIPSELGYLTDITELDLSGNQLTGSIPEALGNLTNLILLDLRSNSISDISALSGLINLISLDLRFNSISDISVLSGLTNLRRLELRSNSISDISALSGLINLTWLDLGSGSNSISDISALSGLTNLTVLGLDSNSISDVSALSGLTNLILLDLGSNSISDISALSGLTNLTGLYLQFNSISDISVLSGLTNLTRLHLLSNSISDISVLSGLTNLIALGLSNNSISDVSALSGLTNLTWLRISHNNISDISVLSGLTNLIALGLGSTSISDISALSGLINLTELYLAYTSISDISALSGLINLTWLELLSNSISDLSPLIANAGLGSGDTVDIRNNPLSETSIQTHIPTLQGRGVSVFFGAFKPAVEEIERRRAVKFIAPAYILKGQVHVDKGR